MKQYRIRVEQQTLPEENPNEHYSIVFELKFYCENMEPKFFMLILDAIEEYLKPRLVVVVE